MKLSCCGAALLLLWVLFPHTLLYWSRILISPFLYGRSFYQVKFLLLSVISLLLVAPITTIFPIKVGVRKVSVIVFLSGVLLLFILQIATQMYVAGKLELPSAQSFILVKDGVVSSSSIAHIHTGKSVLTALLRMFTSSSTISDGDAGLAFYYFLGPIFSAGFTSLFLVTFVSFIFLVFSLFQSSDSDVVETLLFIVAGLIVLKSGVDGGIFSKGVPLFISICLYTLRASSDHIEKRSLLTVMPRLLGIVVPLSMFLSAVMFFDPLMFEDSLAQILYFSILSYVSPVIFICAFLLFERVLFGPKRVLSALLCIVIVILWSRAILSSSMWRDEHRYLQTIIPAGASVHYFTDSRAKLLSTDVTTKVTTMSEFYRDRNLRPGIRNVAVTVPGEACTRQLDFSFDIRILEGEIKNLVTRNWINLTFSPCNVGQWCTFRVYGTLKDCAPAQTAHHAPTFNLLSESGIGLYAVRNFTYHGAGSGLGFLGERGDERD